MRIVKLCSRSTWTISRKMVTWWASPRGISPSETSRTPPRWKKCRAGKPTVETHVTRILLASRRVRWNRLWRTSFTPKMSTMTSIWTSSLESANKTLSRRTDWSIREAEERPLREWAHPWYKIGNLVHSRAGKWDMKDRGILPILEFRAIRILAFSTNNSLTSVVKYFLVFRVRTEASAWTCRQKTSDSKPQYSNRRSPPINFSKSSRA